MTIALQQQIDCVAREIKMREYVYPGRVRLGKMKQEAADYELDAMRAVQKTLTAFRDHRCGPGAGLDEALNAGNGTYKP